MPTDSQFRDFVTPHLDALYRLAYRLTGTVADAEDLVQDVLIKLYERREELGSIREIAPWAKRVLYNRFIDQTRRFQRQRLQVVADDFIDNAVADPSSSPSDDPSRDLERALTQLSDDHRVVVLLHDAEGYKLEEIQEITGTSLGTIKSRLHRARARLRAILEPDGTISSLPACMENDGARFDGIR